MALINQDKPSIGTPQTELNVGSGYNLLVGGVYKLIIGAINAGAGLTNTSKVSIGETWNTVATTWDSETRTWLAVSQLFTNQAMSTTDPLWSNRTLPWAMALPWQDTDKGITNESKP